MSLLCISAPIPAANMCSPSVNCMKMGNIPAVPIPPRQALASTRKTLSLACRGHGRRNPRRTAPSDEHVHGVAYGEALFQEDFVLVG